MYAILGTVSSCILCVSLVCQNRDANGHSPPPTHTHTRTPSLHGHAVSGTPSPTSPPTDVSIPVDNNLTNYLVAESFILVCDLLPNSLFYSLSLRITYNNNVTHLMEDVS